MNRKFFSLMLIVFCLGAGMFIVGCEDDEDDVNVTGTWNIVANTGDTGVMSLTQSGSSVTGSISVLGMVSSQLCGGVSGSSLTLSGGDAYYMWYLSATVTSSTMSGTWADSDDHSVVWTATKQ